VISFVAMIAFVAAASNADPYTTHVGVPTKIEQLVLPGSELEVKPLDDRKLPVVLRIVSVDQHGTAYRYDLVYYTLDPGKFDLRDYLRRKDGTALGNLPELKVTAISQLPNGQVLPHELTAGRPAFTGGYWLAVIAAGGLWLLGFLAILLVGRKKKHEESAEVGVGGTLADRLRPLVKRGLAGKLELSERADLERSLLAFWTKKLKLDELKPAERFARLRIHADAGPLLNQLEAWLHQPGVQSSVDVTSLLRPYQNLPADVLDPVPEVVAV
jgi:hypothetical protein